MHPVSHTCINTYKIINLKGTNIWHGEDSIATYTTIGGVLPSEDEDDTFDADLMFDNNIETLWVIKLTINNYTYHHLLVKHQINTVIFSIQQAIQWTNILLLR